MLLFVYGTLMRGERNQLDMEKVGAEFVGEFTTEAKYNMYKTGQFPTVTPGGKIPIAGEVWRVSPDGFAHLDARESIHDDTGEPSGLERMQIKTPYGDAWMYVSAEKPDAPEIKSGNWREVCK